MLKARVKVVRKENEKREDRKRDESLEPVLRDMQSLTLAGIRGVCKKGRKCTREGEKLREGGKEERKGKRNLLELMKGKSHVKDDEKMVGIPEHLKVRTSA